ncbi:hypothetical protein NHH03_18165 [Stieleria sp. TO1_6]|uniref:hypothetical protein n=1 Tax=Stieleria tagensis TaxID=2956795 RepID=UPI00209B4716|nr:hypothetical protein [Stieleria tagensis]MCO8123676.1 hypothetical protein [Stieleria tagensis]
MKRIAKKILVAVAVTAVSAQSALPVAACDGRGSRIARPAGSGRHPASIYRRPAPAPVYHQARYAQPTYTQPTYTQPSYRVVPQSTPIAATAARPAPSPQPVAQSVPSRTAPAQSNVANTPSQGQPTSTKTAAAAIPAEPTSSSDAESSALAALASLVTQTDNSDADVVPSFAPAASQNNLAHVGSWMASLPSKVTIELQLNDSGSFTWVVNNNGKTTEFSGQYRITDGRLTLVRSNDLQQMAGQWTAGENGFTFKLDGAKNGGLDFQKAS